MNWVVLYKDGDDYSSVNCAWRHLPRDKEIELFGVYDQTETLQALEDYDIYFYSIQAVASPVMPKPYYECMLLAGFKRNSGEGELIKAYYDPKKPVDRIKVNLRDFDNFGDNCFIGR